MALEGFQGAIGTRTANRGDAEVDLQIFEVNAAPAHLALDVTVRHTTADADDHGRVGVGTVVEGIGIANVRVVG